MQVFGKMVSILLAAVICFLGPAELLLQRQEAISEMAVMEMAVSYLEQWKQQGCITKESYENFLQELSDVGGWQLELEYERRVVEPNPGEEEIEVGYVAVPQRELMRVLEQEGILVLGRGDSLEILIKPIIQRNRKGQTSEKVIRYGGIVIGEYN